MKKSILVALVSIGLIGCGGQPLEVWKVSKEVTAKKKCTNDNNTTSAPADTDYRNAETWELYDDAEDKYRLRIAGHDYEGTKEGGSYKFSGEKKTHDYQSGTNDYQQITTYEVSVTVKVDGNYFSGTMEESENSSCTGSSCNPTNGTNRNYTCTPAKSNIYGIKVKPDSWPHNL